ncbi:MAG: dienelactone hydrolase family protein, partial [Phototrophicaceae bacterium]
MKWIARILGGLLVAIVVMVLVIAGVIAADVMGGVSAADFTNTELTAEDGTTINGYLVSPEGEGPFPAVLMVHEWWGLNQEIIELADELSAEGYVVFAPDTYRGPTAGSIPGALYLRLTIDMEQVDSDMLVAYNYLLEQPQVSGNIGVIGFCFGGDVAFNHGIANPDIDAVVNLYGSTLADATMFGALLDDDAPPVLGIFGAEDQGIPVESVNAYEA